MKKIVVALLFLYFALSASAQRVYFVYLQSEKQAPFYVKMGDKVHSSTFTGYLILSSLKDSSYAFSLGFPGGTRGESKFNFIITNSDKGYLIKDLDDGVALFDLQNLTLLKSVSAAPKSTGQQTVLRTDPFTQLLSQTSDDASLLTASVTTAETQKEVKSPEVKKEAVKEEEKTAPPVEATMLEKTAESIPPTVDTIAAVVEKAPKVQQQDSAVVEVREKLVDDSVETRVTETASQEKVYVRSVVTRRSESSTTEGFGLVFLDNQAGVIDTIRLLIPSAKFQLRDEAPANVDTPITSVTTDKAPVESRKVVQAAPTSSCVAVATDRDFLKLRKNMAAETNEEDMISIARKQFRSKCFTTDQLRNLSTLFLTSASKYQFFDAAYSAASDRSGFTSLGAELKDEYYIKRFKALIGE